MPAPIAQNKTEEAAVATHTDKRAVAPQQKRGDAGRSVQETPVEVIRVLNPHTVRPDLEESPVRSRAGMLAAWLRDGGDRAELPTLPREQQEPSPGAESTAQRSVAKESLKTAPLPLPSRQLVLRLQLLSGEIVEQTYGPSKRWAILDGEGEMLESPDAADVQPLIDRGFLALSRFERGGAVWKLQHAAAEERAAYRPEGRPVRKLAC